jgi:hypothetical protein
VGADKDSERRQREAVEAFAGANGYEIIDSYYDAAVSGADAVTARPGFSAGSPKGYSISTTCIVERRSWPTSWRRRLSTTALLLPHCMR